MNKKSSFLNQKILPLRERFSQGRIDIDDYFSLTEKVYDKIKRMGQYPTRFKKGHIPWTAGKKGLRLSPATEFKKNNIPKNHKPVGTIVTRTHKRGYSYRMTKIAEPNKWEVYPRHVWKNHYGFILKGDVIRHINKNGLDDSIENLVAIPRGLNAVLNRGRKRRDLTLKEIEFYRNRYKK